MADKRYRNFATVLYPESCVDNWKCILDDLHIPILVSPLHDNDVNPTGEEKKAHYHILIMFEGKKSLEQVKVIFDSIGAVGIEVVNSIRGYARYLIHADNPEKFQYDSKDVLSMGGADFSQVCSLPSDKYKVIGEIIDYCKDNHISSYSDVLEYARSFKYDWFRILCDSGTVVVKEYLKSKSWKDKFF